LLNASGLHPIADALVETHKDLDARTKTALAQVTVKAAEEAAAQAPLQVQNASQLRDLAASAARIFGWDSNKPGVQLNQQFVISQEMIDRIREAADADDPYKKPATR
jgi:hypothetical protein